MYIRWVSSKLCIIRLQMPLYFDYLIIQTSDWAEAMIALYAVLQEHFCIQNTCFASEDGTFCSQPGQSLQQQNIK